MTDRRVVAPRAALGFLQLPPCAPELQLLHRRLDTWTGLGLVVVGVERQGPRFSLSHIAEGEWRAYFMESLMFSAGPVRRGEDAVARGADGSVLRAPANPIGGMTIALHCAYGAQAPRRQS
jgi:hypothetical protein